MLALSLFRRLAGLQQAHNLTRNGSNLLLPNCTKDNCMPNLHHSLTACAATTSCFATSRHRTRRLHSPPIMRRFREGDLTPSGHRLKLIMASTELNIDDYHKKYDYEHKSVLQKALAT